MKINNFASFQKNQVGFKSQEPIYSLNSQMEPIVGGSDFETDMSQMFTLSGDPSRATENRGFAGSVKGNLNDEMANQNNGLIATQAIARRIMLQDFSTRGMNEIALPENHAVNISLGHHGKK